MGYVAVSLGLFIFLFAFFTLNAPQKQQTPASDTTGFCKLVDPDDAPTFQAPPDNITKTGSENDETLGTVVSSGGCGGTQARHQFPSTLTTYRLIRKNVPLSTTDVKKKAENFTGNSCHFDSAEELHIEIPEVDNTKYKVFFPEISGEISLGREIPSRTRERDRDLMYFIDYGLVFLLHRNPEGGFTEYKGGTTQGTSETFYLADVYQDIESGRPELPSDAFACDTTQGAANASKGKVIVPGQDPSATQDQLQLEYFVFNDFGEVVNGWGIHCKPAIYLYPPQKQLVNVKVHPSGFLTSVDPPYDKEKGWTVEANPDGKLQPIYDLRFTIYDYLYFESKIRDEVIKKPAEGWFVKSKEEGVKREESEESNGSEESKVWFTPLENHFKDILPKLGLNAQQTNDFIEYWKKTLPEAPYYFVGIIDPENVNEIERLEITPKPDSINRVRVYFERLDSPKEVETPTLPPYPFPLSPDSFAVIEWGGMVKNDPDHPFTCSQ